MLSPLPVACALAEASACLRSPSIWTRLCSASARLALPSSAMRRLSSIVAIRSSLAFSIASMSKTPRSISVRISALAVRRFSAFFVRSSLVRSLASLTTPAASRPRWIVTAWASWVSQSGTVLTSVELILVTRLLSFSCTSRIDGSDCIVTCRVSFRSCTRRSRSSRAARMSRSSCAFITPWSSGAALTSASLAGIVVASSSASLASPAAM